MAARQPPQCLQRQVAALPRLIVPCLQELRRPLVVAAPESDLALFEPGRAVRGWAELIRKHHDPGEIAVRRHRISARFREVGELSLCNGQPERVAQTRKERQALRKRALGAGEIALKLCGRAEIILTST